jgi:hypothetical protein
VELELKPMPHWVDVNIALLETFPLVEINVNPVFLEVLPLELEQLNANNAHAVMKHLWIEQIVSFVQLANFLCLAETAHSVQMEPSVSELHLVSALNVDLELKPMPHWVDVNIALLETSQLGLGYVNLVLLDQSQPDLEQLTVINVLVVMKHLLIEQLVFLVDLDYFPSLEETVHFVLLELWTMEPANVVVMNVDLELKPILINLLVNIVPLEISHVDLDNVNLVLLDQLLEMKEQVNVNNALAGTKHL